MREGRTKSFFSEISLRIIELEEFPAPSSSLLEGNLVRSGGEMSTDSIST